jgi:hypothetical protein
MLFFMMLTNNIFCWKQVINNAGLGLQVFSPVGAAGIVLASSSRTKLPFYAKFVSSSEFFTIDNSAACADCSPGTIFPRVVFSLLKQCTHNFVINTAI